MRPPSPSSRDRTTRWVLRVCLLASGAAALIYEVLWLRQFGLVMGNTAYALSTVLSSFLGGLALGAYVGGRWTRNRKVSPRLYAAIEIAVAATALAMPTLIAACAPLFGLAYRSLADHFVAYNVVQFLICGSLLFVPTFLMGTTLPLVTALVVRPRDNVPRETGMLYALNSLGGVLGAGAAGFLLLPGIGMWATGMLAAGLNVAAALLAVVFAASVPASTTNGPPPRQQNGSPLDQGAAVGAWASPGVRTLTILYGLSGFAALVLEVGWARIVGLAIGSTTYGFTITLVTFIAGLSIGSFVAPRLTMLTRDPVRAIFAFHVVIALWILVSLPYLGELPLRVVQLMGPGEVDFVSLLAGETLLVQLTILVPTFAMGATFPLVTQLVHRATASTGHAAGITYAANTVGNIAGSWIAGFLLIPVIGMQGVIQLAAVLYGFVGLLFLLPGAAANARRSCYAAAALVSAMAVAAWVSPPWSRELISSAPYLAGPEITKLAPDRIDDAVRGVGGKLVDYRESATGVVTVRSKAGALGLYQDGMQESGTGSHSIRLLGHLALLFHGSAKDVLVIGLGGGQTLRGVLAHPVDSVESIETSRDVLDVAQQFFAGDVLADPRSRVLIGDGRNHLRHSGRRYDAIISQPSYPWVSGASNLFTREFFIEMRDHLEPGGVAASWFFTHSREASRSIVHAWAEAFPESYLLNAMGGPRVLIGFAKPHPVDQGKLLATLDIPGVAADLRTFGVSVPADVLRMILARGDELRRFAGEAPISTDDNGFVAFHALRRSKD